ncbi:hypothetical protein KKF34_04165 [Myxococcota bacterium]|nr:hypothetical protein [Myxococcota bacterium]MBU1380197.1 hypothetical protein [Myxococcota bacterium]MBU1496052.1 hypothetical protein [Myxococcota bacterium]
MENNETGGKSNISGLYWKSPADCYSALSAYLESSPEERIRWLSQYMRTPGGIKDIFSLIHRPAEKELDTLIKNYARGIDYGFLKKWYDERIEEGGSDVQNILIERAMLEIFSLNFKSAESSLRQALEIKLNPVVLWELSRLAIQEGRWGEFAGLGRDLISLSDNSELKDALSYMIFLMESMSGSASSFKTEDLSEKHIHYLLASLHSTSSWDLNQSTQVLSDIFHQLKDPSPRLFALCVLMGLEFRNSSFEPSKYFEISMPFMEGNSPESLALREIYAYAILRLDKAQRESLLPRFIDLIKKENPSRALSLLFETALDTATDGEMAHYVVENLNLVREEEPETVDILASTIAFSHGITDENILKDIRFPDPVWKMLLSGETTSLELIKDSELSIGSFILTDDVSFLDYPGAKWPVDWKAYIAALCTLKSTGKPPSDYSSVSAIPETFYFELWSRILNNRFDDIDNFLHKQDIESQDIGLLKVLSDAMIHRQATEYVSVVMKVLKEKEGTDIDSDLKAFFSSKTPEDAYFWLSESLEKTSSQDARTHITLILMRLAGEMNDIDSCRRLFAESGHISEVRALFAEIMRLHEPNDSSITEIITESSDCIDNIEFCLNECSNYYKLTSHHDLTSAWYRPLIQSDKSDSFQLGEFADSLSSLAGSDRQLIEMIYGLQMFYAADADSYDAVEEWTRYRLESSPALYDTWWTASFCLREFNSSVNYSLLKPWQVAETIITLADTEDDPDQVIKLPAINDPAQLAVADGYLRIHYASKKNWKKWIKYIDISQLGAPFAEEFSFFTDRFGSLEKLENVISPVLRSIFYPWMMDVSYRSAFTSPSDRGINPHEMQSFIIEATGDYGAAMNYRISCGIAATASGALFLRRASKYTENQWVAYKAVLMLADLLPSAGKHRKEILYEVAAIAWELKDYLSALRAYWIIYRKYPEESKAITGALNVSLYAGIGTLSGYLFREMKRTIDESELTGLFDSFGPETIKWLNDNSTSVFPYGYLDDDHKFSPTAEFVTDINGVKTSSEKATELICVDMEKFAPVKNCLDFQTSLAFLLYTDKSAKVIDILDANDRVIPEINEIYRFAAGFRLESQSICEKALGDGARKGAIAWITLNDFWCLIHDKPENRVTSSQGSVFDVDWLAFDEKFSEIASMYSPSPFDHERYIADVLKEKHNLDDGEFSSEIFAHNIAVRRFRKTHDFDVFANLSPSSFTSSLLILSGKEVSWGESDNSCNWFRAVMGQGKFSTVKASSEPIAACLYYSDYTVGKDISEPVVPVDRSFLPHWDLASRIVMRRGDDDLRRAISLQRGKHLGNSLLSWGKRHRGNDSRENYYALNYIDSCMDSGFKFDTDSPRVNWDDIPAELHKSISDMLFLSSGTDTPNCDDLLRLCCLISDGVVTYELIPDDLVHSSPAWAILSVMTGRKDPLPGADRLMDWYLNNDLDSLAGFLSVVSQDICKVSALAGFIREEISGNYPAFLMEKLDDSLKSRVNYRQCLRRKDHFSALDYSSCIGKGHHRSVMDYFHNRVSGNQTPSPAFSRKNWFIFDHMVYSGETEALSPFVDRKSLERTGLFSFWLSAFIAENDMDLLFEKYSKTPCSGVLTFLPDTHKSLKTIIDRYSRTIANPSELESFRIEALRLAQTEKAQFVKPADFVRMKMEKSALEAVYSFMLAPVPENAVNLLEYCSDGLETEFYRYRLSEMELRRKKFSPESGDTLKIRGPWHAGGRHNLMHLASQIKEYNILKDLIKERLDSPDMNQMYNDSFEGESLQHLYASLCEKTDNIDEASLCYLGLLQENPSDEAAFIRGITLVFDSPGATNQFLEIREPVEKKPEILKAIQWKKLYNNALMSKPQECLENVLSSDLRQVSKEAGIYCDVVRIINGDLDELETDFDTVPNAMEKSTLYLMKADASLLMEDQILLYRQATQCWPENIIAWRNLAVVLDEEGNEESCNAIANALKVNWTDSFRLANLVRAAQISEKTGKNRKKAREYLISAMELSPVDIEVIHAFTDLMERDSDRVFRNMHFKSHLRKLGNTRNEEAPAAAQAILKILQDDIRLPFVEALVGAKSSAPEFLFDLSALLENGLLEKLLPADFPKPVFRLAHCLTVCRASGENSGNEIAIPDYISAVCGTTIRVFESTTQGPVVKSVSGGIHVFIPAGQNFTDNELAVIVIKSYYLFATGLDFFNSMTTESIRAFFEDFLNENLSGNPDGCVRKMLKQTSGINTPVTEVLTGIQTELRAIDKNIYATLGGLTEKAANGAAFIASGLIGSKTEQVQSVLEIILDDSFIDFYNSARLYRLK